MAWSVIRKKLGIVGMLINNSGHDQLSWDVIFWCRCHLDVTNIDREMGIFVINTVSVVRSIFNWKIATFALLSLKKKQNKTFNPV